jgi:hypothetical protein
MKNSIKSVMYKVGIGAGVLAWILLTSKDALAQNIASNDKNTNKTEVNTTNSITATDFAVANVGKYYPDMVDYTKTLMNSFLSKEQKNVVNTILKELIKKYPNDKDKVSFIISTLEWRVLMTKPIFTDTYCLEPTDLDFDLDDAFNNSYRARFNANLANLQQRVKEIEENIKNKEENIKNKEENIKNKEENIKNKEENIKNAQEETKKNIEEVTKILETFSIEDIKNNETAYETLKKN